MLYRFDFHTHSFFSADASSKPERMVEVAKLRGLSGIAITDHNTCRVVDYCLQKGLMREDGLPVNDFLIIPGVEISTADGHLLCIGITLPDRKGIPAQQVADEIRARGGIPVPAHPFDRWRAGICSTVMDRMRLDVVEAFNAASSRKKYNEQARAYAERRSLKMTAGSDAHHPTAVGVCWTSLELEMFSLANVIQQLLKATQIEEHSLTFFQGITKRFYNWFRPFNKSPS